MTKSYIFITHEDQQIEVMGKQFTYKNGVLSCEKPVSAVRAKPGDAFAVMLAAGQDHEIMEVVPLGTPKGLNSFVAWLCGYSGEKRTRMNNYAYIRHNFQSRAYDGGKVTERTIGGALSLARVDFGDGRVVRLWAGIGMRSLTEGQVLYFADLFMEGSDPEWISLRLKERFGLLIEPDALREAMKKEGVTE